MERKKKIMWISGLIAVLLVGVVSYRIYTNIAANKERAGRNSQGRAVTVEVSSVTRQTIKPILTFSANLEPVWSADISAKLDGRINDLFVDEGDKVTRGMVIATLDTNELAAQVMQAEGNLLSNRASLEQAELDLKRTDALYRQGAVSIQSLDTARTKRDLAIGQVRSAEGNLALLQARLDNAMIISPRDGIVAKRYLQSGYYAKAGAQIVAIADVTSLLAKANIGEGQINEFAVGDKVVVRVAALPGKEFYGTISRVSPTALLPARTFIAEITINNEAGILKNGMFATVDVPSKPHVGVLAVPEGAIVMREDQKTVFVVLADNKVQQRVVNLGYVGGGWAEILGGVGEGDKIVVAGQNKLKDGAGITSTSLQEGEVK